MRILFTITACFVLSATSVGCGNNTSVASPSSGAAAEDGLTTEQLTAALGIRHWKYRCPDDIGDKVIALKVTGGPAPTMTEGIGGWQAGEVVTICVRSLLPNNALECTMVSDRGYSRSMINNTFLGCRSVGHSKNGTFVGDTPLIKGNVNGQVSMTAEAPGDISLTVVVKEPEPATPPTPAG